MASRNVAHLTYIDCDSFEKQTVSLNNALWDTHVSFSVLSLALSPCQEFLLAATGRSRRLRPFLLSQYASCVLSAYFYVSRSRLNFFIFFFPTHLADKSRVILYRIGHNEQLRSLYGHRADEYRYPLNNP